MRRRFMILGRKRDRVRPTATITSSETSPSAVLPVPITVTLSEAATDFAVGDLTLGNCTVASFAGSGTSYTCTATPTTPNGTFTIDIAENAFHDAAGNGNTAATQFSFTSSAFTIADEFTDTVAAGAVHNTTATPTGGTRTVTDTNSKISVGSGVLSFASGLLANEGLWYAGQARSAGKTVFFSVTETQANLVVGWDTNAAGGRSETFNLNGTSGQIVSGFGAAFTVATIATATNYKLASVLRATGVHWFIKGGIFTVWTHLYTTKAGSGATMFPGVGNAVTTTIATADYVRLPATATTITPLASDAFTRADGNLGNTGGGGSEESGGSGLAWTAQAGTWGVASNVAAASALSGGIAIATVPCGTINVNVECAVTRSAGNAGIVLRYADANNYIYALHNGTNAQLIKVVAGSPTTLVNAAATYAAGARLIVSANDTKFRLYYNDAAVGSEQTISDAGLQTGQAHGLYTSDTGNTLDNFVVWAKGIGSEYENTFNRYTSNP